MSVCTDFDSEPIEFEGEYDHVHLPVNYPPKVAVSKLVNSLEGISSLMIRKKNGPNIRKKLWGGALWSPSYFAESCGGAPISLFASILSNGKRHAKLKAKERKALPSALTSPP